MNLIDIIILLILALSLVSGMQKGFLASLLAVAGFVGAWFGAGSIYMNLTQSIMSNTTLMNALASNLSTDSLIENVVAEGTTVANAINSGAMSQLTGALRAKNMPAALISAFEDHAVNSATASKFADMTVNTYLNQTIWQSVFNVVGFLVVFAICYAVALLIVNLLNHTFHFPELRGFNSVLGGIFGLVRGYIIVCLIIAIVPMMISTINSSLVNDLMANSRIGSFFMSANPLADMFHVNDWISTIIQALPKV